MLVRGDCLNFAKAKPGASYDLVVSDSPYFGCVEDEWDNQWATPEAYFAWLEERVAQFARVLSGTGNLLFYCKRQFLANVKLMLDKYLAEQRIIIWARRQNANQTRGKTLASGYEPILWYSKSPDNYTFNGDSFKGKPRQDQLKRKEYQKGGSLEDGVSLSDVWADIPALRHNSPEGVFHPAQKPIALSKRIVNLFSNKNDRVLVPFAGSGSEILACIQLGRRWDATETSAEYYNAAKKRIQKHGNTIENYFVKA